MSKKRMERRRAKRTHKDDSSQEIYEKAGPLKSDWKGMFNAPDGTTLHYESYGKGFPILLLYGLTCRKEHWRHQIQYLRKNYQLIVVDYRGHQSSAQPDNIQNLTLDWCAKDIQALIDHLEIPKTVVVGHSLGVPIAALNLLWDPKRVIAGALICGSVHNPFSEMLGSDWSDKVLGFYEKAHEVSPDIVSKIFHGAWKIFTKPSRFNYWLTSQLGFNAGVAQSEDINSYIEGVYQAPSEVFFHLAKDYRTLDLKPRLKEISQPVLVMAGTQDRITPMRSSETLVQLLPKGKLFRIEKGSHNSHTDFPHIVNKALADFLKELKL